MIFMEEFIDKAIRVYYDAVLRLKLHPITDFV
jgi:hypothetical protein